MAKRRRDGSSVALNCGKKGRWDLERKIPGPCNIVLLQGSTYNITCIILCVVHTIAYVIYYMLYYILGDNHNTII